MRIVIVAPLYPPATGGSATYYKLLTDCLGDREGIDRVTVLTSKWPGAPKKEERGKVTVLRRLPALPMARSRAGWLLGEAWRVPVSFFVTLSVILSTRSRLVHAHKTRSYGGSVLAGRLLRRPVIGDVRDLHDLDLYRLSTRFIACGAAAVEKLREGGVPGNRIELHPVPMDLEPEVSLDAYEELAADCLEGRGYILFVGDISERKGVPELLEGFRYLREGRDDIDLVLVGKALLDRDRMQDISKREGVHVLDPLPHPEVLGLMRRAEVLILPSRFELYPRVCIEGVLMGTRVIFPPAVPEFREEVGDFVLPEVSGEAIRTLLEKVLVSDARPDYPVERHDHSRVCEKVFELYRELLAR